MAIGKSGPQGFLSGKLGDLVYYVRNGKQFVRRRRAGIVKPPSEAQLASRKKLAVVVEFLKPLLGIVNIGFLLLAKANRGLPYAQAVKYNRLHAVSGVYPDVVIDYAKVMLTRGSGNVAEALMATVSLVEEGLKFEWQFDAGGYWSAASDQVMLFVYFPELKSTAYRLYGAQRKDCSDLLALTEVQLASRMEVYISFIAADRGGISDSAYLGRFN